MEEIKDVRVVIIDYRCPICNNGYLRPTGQVLMCHPAEYPHKCTNVDDCKYEETFSGVTYPHLDYI